MIIVCPYQAPILIKRDSKVHEDVYDVYQITDGVHRVEYGLLDFLGKEQQNANVTMRNLLSSLKTLRTKIKLTAINYFTK